MSLIEEIFQRLHDATEIATLIGKSEDLHLECKTWSANDGESQKGLAKAICGFANADGGVIVIGLTTTTSADKFTPDVINGSAPVANIQLLKSRIESFIPEIVEPLVEGVTVASVPESSGSTSGFVLVKVPPTDGTPCRSRKDWRMYQRINSGTYGMEYFQIADMFGKRQRPKLSLYLEDLETCRPQPVGNPGFYEREFVIGIENTGRAIARFPAIRFKRVPGVNPTSYGIDGNGRTGLPQLPTEPDFMVFGGGAEYVVYPGTVLKVVKLTHRSKGSGFFNVSTGRKELFFEELKFTAELAADGFPSTSDSKTLPYLSIP